MTLGFTLGELFSGPGGIAVGTHLAARETGTPLKDGCANDHDESAVAMYRANIDGATYESVICQDVSSLDIDSRSEWRRLLKVHSISSAPSKASTTSRSPNLIATGNPVAPLEEVDA